MSFSSDHEYGGEGSPARDSPGNMDWERRYFDSLEHHMREIKDEIMRNEGRIYEVIREAMYKIYLQSDQRHREYLSVQDRMNEVMNVIDKKQNDQNKWILRSAIAVILGVASLVSTGIFGIVKFIDLIPRP